MLLEMLVVIVAGNDAAAAAVDRCPDLEFRVGLGLKAPDAAVSLAEYSGTTEQGCSEFCIKSERCVGFDHSTSSGRCRLLQTYMARLELIRDPHFNHFIAIRFDKCRDTRPYTPPQTTTTATALVTTSTTSPPPTTSSSQALVTSTTSTLLMTTTSEEVTSTTSTTSTSTTTTSTTTTTTTPSGPTCVNEAKNCVNFGSPECAVQGAYTGSKRTTVTGKACIKWSQTVSFYAYGEIRKGNYCATSPGGRQAWCFWDHNSSGWEACFHPC